MSNLFLILIRFNIIVNYQFQVTLCCGYLLQKWLLYCRVIKPNTTLCITWDTSTRSTKKLTELSTTSAHGKWDWSKVHPLLIFFVHFSGVISRVFVNIEVKLFVKMVYHEIFICEDFNYTINIVLFFLCACKSVNGSFVYVNSSSGCR